MVDSFQALEFRNTQASNIENIEPVCRFNPYETYYVWSLWRVDVHYLCVVRPGFLELCPFFNIIILHPYREKLGLKLFSKFSSPSSIG